MRRCVPGATAVTFVNKKSSDGPDKKHESNSGVPAVSGNFNESFAAAITKSFFFYHLSNTHIPSARDSVYNAHNNNIIS